MILANAVGMFVYIVVGLFIIGIVASVLVWLVRFLAWPDIVWKSIIALAVLFGLVFALGAIGWLGDDMRFYHPDRGVIVR